LLHQIKTHVWLTALSGTRGRAATLEDIPDAEPGRLVEMGFHRVWFLSVWQTGPAGQNFIKWTNIENPARGKMNSRNLASA